MRGSLIIFIFLLLNASEGFSQFNFRISARVVDQNTEFPIPFTSIKVDGNTYGTLTNTNGFFALTIPEASRNAKLIISAINYKTQFITIDSLLNVKNPIIELKQQNIALADVIVKSKELRINPKKVLLKAINKIPRNYDQSKYELTAFFQTTAFDPWIKKDNLNHYEAILKIQDNGIDFPADSSIAIQILKLKKMDEVMEKVSFSDSLSLSLMMKTITGQNHYNQVFNVYAVDIIKQIKGSILTESPFRENAVLNYDLEFDGTIDIDSISCYKIIAIHKETYKGKNSSALNNYQVPVESYKFLLPPNTPQHVVDSMYKKFISSFDNQNGGSAIQSFSNDKDIFYIDKESFAVIRYEKETIFNNTFYSKWINYHKVGEKYYPHSMSKIGPIFFRKQEDTASKSKPPYFISTMIVTGVNKNGILSIPKI